MSSLCVKFQPSSTPPTDRFWWGVLVVVVVLVLVVLLVTGVKQSQLLGLRLSLEFDNKEFLPPPLPFIYFVVVHCLYLNFMTILTQTLRVCGELGCCV